jgi:hypothetical protein
LCLVWGGVFLSRGVAAETPSAAGESSSVRANLSSVASVVARIDELIGEGWQAQGIRGGREASDSEWCRRVHLDLIGRIPTLAEQQRFLSEPAASRRTALVDRLLGGDYRAEYARHWSSIWTNLLIGRTGGTERNSPTSRPGMVRYLEVCFLENRPYDQMVRELITASGGARPEMENFNGAVNFLVEKLADGGVQATAKTSQLFLGMAVQCTQCHNHPFNESRQNQFWELNAFYRQTTTRIERKDDDDPARYATVVDRDFSGEGRRRGFDNRGEVYLEMRDGKLVDRDAAEIHAAPIYYELRNGQVQVAYPVFLDGTSLADAYAARGSEYGNSGSLEHVDRRQELAALVLASDELGKAIVNRMWAHFLGHGFTKPVDDMGPHNPPSHPELLEELAKATRRVGFDLQMLCRWIVLSRPYALSSRVTSGNRDDDPSQGRPPMFSRFYVRQMSAEQLYESLLAATQADAAVASENRDTMRSRWLAQFSTAFGNDEGTEATTFNGSIPQALTLMNGDLVAAACRTGSGSFLDQVATNGDLTDRDKIVMLYRAALGRQPTKLEIQVADELLKVRRGDVVEALQDVWWAVLNSNEFILIH